MVVGSHQSSLADCACAFYPGVPLYKVWVVVSKRTATPLNATWAMTALAFFLGLPILFSPSTFLAMGSISFAGLYISCECLTSLQHQSEGHPSSSSMHSALICHLLTLPGEHCCSIHVRRAGSSPSGMLPRTWCSTFPACLAVRL